MSVGGAAPQAVPGQPGTVLVMNPRSGGGTVARSGLPEAAERLGAEVLLTAPDQDAAMLARRAAADGARLLGVAGGDGTVAAVAAIAAEAGLPLLVVPAGTRNHFARDLGLDIRDPLAALAALRGGEPVLVDLAAANGRIFLNNVSFGPYADALLTPDYREAKAQALAVAAGPYLEGRQVVDVELAAPTGTIQRPQLVLISNNPYHLATPYSLGRRFSLGAGALGVIVAKWPAGVPPAPLPRLVHDTAERGGTPGPEGLIVWSAPRVVLQGPASAIAAGVDGEPVTFSLPVTCESRPGALRVLLPPDRPGVPDEPHPPLARRKERGSDRG